jgi:hypothetical protein
VICPLITPFGLFYMLMKQGTDKYNIYFAYKRSKINKECAHFLFRFLRRLLIKIIGVVDQPMCV